MSRLPVPAPTAEPTAAPSTSADGRARRWWTPKADCPCVQNRRRTATTRRQDAPPAVEPAEGVALPVEGVRVCDAPRAVQNARPVQGVRASSAQTDSARPAESARASRTVPVGRAVEGGRVLPGTPVATVEAAWPVGSRGDGTMHARRHLYGGDPYYDDAYYYDGRYYRRRRGYARDDGTMLLGGLLLADLFLF